MHRHFCGLCWTAPVYRSSYMVYSPERNFFTFQSGWKSLRPFDQIESLTGEDARKSVILGERERIPWKGPIVLSRRAQLRSPLQETRCGNLQVLAVHSDLVLRMLNSKKSTMSLGSTATCKTREEIITEGPSQTRTHHTNTHFITATKVRARWRGYGSFRESIDSTSAC